MDSEEESAFEEAEVESEEESDSGVASLALASAFVAKSIFNTKDNGPLGSGLYISVDILKDMVACWYAWVLKS